MKNYTAFLLLVPFFAMSCSAKQTDVSSTNEQILNFVKEELHEPLASYSSEFSTQTALCLTTSYELIQEYCGFVLDGSENHSRYLVDYENTNGIFVAFRDPNMSSASAAQYRYGEDNPFVIGHGESCFETYERYVGIEFLLQQNFIDDPKEMFFNITQIENGHYVAISTMVLYPYQECEEHWDIGIYHWKFEEIGGYSFPKVDGEYQEITKEFTDSLFQETKEKSSGKYYENKTKN